MNDPNHDNPYRSPETITGAEPRPSAVLSRDQLYAIASWHKGLRFGAVCFAGVMATSFIHGGVGRIALESANGPPSWLQVLLLVIFFALAAFLVLATLLMFISSAVLIAHFSNAWIAIAAAVLILPFAVAPPFGLLLYLVMEIYTTRVLKRHGIRVGLWGAKLSEIQ